MLDDGEAEAGAARVATASRIDAVEPLEHALAIFFGNADPLVGHGDLDRSAAGIHADADARAVGRVVDGVRDEVMQPNPEEGFVAVSLKALVAARGQLDAVFVGRNM